MLSTIPKNCFGLLWFGPRRSYSIQESTKKWSPVTFVDAQTKDFMKSKLHENQKIIWRSCVEASIYCAIFHEMKKFLKHKTAKHG